MTEFAVFGDPKRFEVALRWAKDDEPHSRRPRVHGWSMGDLRITVGNVVLTRHRRGAVVHAHATWYLSPVLSWVADNWVSLLHEEDFAWPERRGASAALACLKALAEWIGASDEAGRATYASIHAWYRRHALQSAAEGGLLPGIFIRRLVDEVELSWVSTVSPFAPQDFAVAMEPGVARLPVEDVAGPLWEVLGWVVSSPPGLSQADREQWQMLARSIEALPSIPTAVLRSAYLPEGVPKLIERLGRRKEAAPLLEDRRLAEVPVLTQFSPAVAMFGGVKPNLSAEDARILFSALQDAWGGSDTEELHGLVEGHGLSPLTIPHEDGDDFAARLIDDLGIGRQDWIDIRSICRKLGIDVKELTFRTADIRGVALAGDSVLPTILINARSIFNRTEEGRRFTIAHELCHILHDRSRARRVTHVSGPWVAQGFEKRANASPHTC